MTIRLYFDTGDIRDVPTWEQDPTWRRNTVSSTLSIEDENGSRSFIAWTYSLGEVSGLEITTLAGDPIVTLVGLDNIVTL